METNAVVKKDLIALPGIFVKHSVLPILMAKSLLIQGLGAMPFFHYSIKNGKF